MCVCLGGVYTPPVNRITDRCKNITFPQLRLRTVIKIFPIKTEQVPEEWQLDLFLEEGTVSESHVRISNADEWKYFDVEDSSVDNIQALFFKGSKVVIFSLYFTLYE